MTARRMSEAEMREWASLVSSLTGGKIRPSNLYVWARDLSHRHDFDSALEAARRAVRAKPYLALADIEEAAKTLRREREAAIPKPQLALPAVSDEEAELRGRVARQVALDIVAGHLPQSVDFRAEVDRRLKGAVK